MSEDNFEEQKVIVDLTGENQESQYEKVLIAKGQMPGKFMSFDLVQIPKYNKPNEKQSKIVVQVQVHDKEKGEVEVPLFLTPLVTKAPEGSSKSNSTLFEVLNNLKLLQDFQKANDSAGGFSFKDLNAWLEETLTGRVASVLVETTKKAKTPYSKIGEVYGFVEEPKVDSEVNVVKDGGQ